ncbi:hypothetical protein J1N35_025638 [Gossypium stocksii]|uniref:GH16 domain-containing protein n=1 Tax=Gossypium stocksii TaxID=47602 RepID=A0A9D3V7E0_9ROSI|nr:hypothetical protein J1N35_025638 [Gossypium stocksii]
MRFPLNQPMKIYSSLWNAKDWAIRGGMQKTNWSKAPFIASYKGSTLTGASHQWKPSSVPPRGNGGGTKRSSRTLILMNGGDSPGFTTSSPSTTIVVIGSDSPPYIPSAREIGTSNI